ncbi:MAG: DUF4160 domain-containing protein [Alphaproteobacteria bacterium]|nr:DUF4160 domain-containing protein [Alphaproteobacteria bacterium]
MTAKPAKPAATVAPDEIAGQTSFDMANLRPERTSLPFVVFISQKGEARHDVRIKLARGPKVRGSEMITIAVRPRPRIIEGRLAAHEFDAVRQWIELNRDVLVDYWNGDIECTEDALSLIRPVPSEDEPLRSPR